MKLYNCKTPLFLAIVLGLSLGTAGCNEQRGANEKTSETKAAAEPQGSVVATVNGEPITDNELEQYRNARSDSAPQQGQEALLDELVTQKLVYQNALQRKLDEDPKVLEELEQMRTRVLVSATVRKAVEENPATEEELRAQYDQLKDSMVIPEYKTSHILVEEEEKAKQLIAQLDDGADFAELAREHSTGPTGEKGGDLGWVNPRQMVPPFSQALQQMENGTYSKEPVETQFGWHVIKLDDNRQSEPPAFEDLKGQLAQMVQQRRVGEFIQGLKDKAEISIEGEADVSNVEEANASTAEEDTGAPPAEKDADASTAEEDTVASTAEEDANASTAEENTEASTAEEDAEAATTEEESDT